MIYFVRSGDYVKIGKTADNSMTRRLSGLQVGSPHELKIVGLFLDISGFTETGFHEMFDVYHHRGEWFRFSKEIKQFLEEIEENILNMHRWAAEEARRELRLVIDNTPSDKTQSDSV